MRAVPVVVTTPGVTVVRRRAAVGVGVATAATVVPSGAVGLSGAAVFWTCVAANAVMLVAESSVTAVANPRSARLELMSGVFLGMETGDHARRPGG